MRITLLTLVRKDNFMSNHCNKSRLEIFQESLEKGYIKKVKAKIEGRVIAIKWKKDQKDKPIVMPVQRNQIVGLSDLISAFYFYMTGVSQSISSSSYGVGITLLSNNQPVSTLTQAPVSLSASSNGAEIAFSAFDGSDSSYTSTQQVLTTQSGGYNIELATASLNITKEADEEIAIYWIISVSVSVTQVNILPIFNGSLGFYSSGPGPGPMVCQPNGFPSSCNPGTSTSGSFSPKGSLSSYWQTNFITSQWFVDFIYNPYGAGCSCMEYATFKGSNSIAIAIPDANFEVNTYCSPPTTTEKTSLTVIFGHFCGWESFSMFESGGSTTWCLQGSNIPGYVPPSPIYGSTTTNEPQPSCIYLGVQIEFST